MRSEALELRMMTIAARLARKDLLGEEPLTPGSDETP
jgi:hypothetical protein